MSEPTNDGKQHPDPDPEKDQDDVQEEVQDQNPDSASSNPTTPIWADPTAAIPPSPAPPGAAHPHDDQPAEHPQVTPPSVPPGNNPYAQGPPPPYAQGPPPPPYGQAPAGQQYQAYSQQPYGGGQHTPANASAIVLTVLSGVSVVPFCNFLSIAPLVLGIVALTKNATDHEGARRLTKIGWIVFAAVWGVAILVIIGLIVLSALSSNNSSKHMLGN